MSKPYKQRAVTIEDVAREFTRDLELRDQLAVALFVARAKAAAKQQQREKENGNVVRLFQNDEAAVSDRDAANERVKKWRAQLDAAPRLHVKRQRKAKPVAQNSIDPFWPTASSEHVADLELTSGGEIRVRRAGQ
jgi:hypothetical protein